MCSGVHPAQKRIITACLLSSRMVRKLQKSSKNKIITNAFVCVCATGLQPMIHFLFVSLPMLTWAKTQRSSTYWILMSIKGSDNSDTRQKRSGEGNHLGSSLPCTTAQICWWLFITKDKKKKKRTNNCNEFDSGSCDSARNGSALCLHLLIGPCMWQQSRSDKGSPPNLALGERFCRQSLGCQPLCPKQGIESAEECSAILADPRCVLNIKSSAVIPLAAPNTNRGLLVAMATALLSNIASGGSASLWLSLFSSTSLLFAHAFYVLTSFFFFSLFCVTCVKGTPRSRFGTNGPRVQVQVHLISSRW